MTIEKEDLKQLREDLNRDMVEANEKTIKAVMKIERAWMEERIRQIVKEESCSCPFSSCQREVIPQFFNMVGDFGGGDYREGILQLRKNHAWTCNTRLKMQNPSQHTDKDEKIAAMSEWIIRNRKKPSDYLQHWRPEE